MISLVKDDEWEMRRGATWILGKLGSHAKDAGICAYPSSTRPNPAVQTKAAQALQKINGENAGL